MNIISISGKARHGKDTLANFIKEEYEKQGQAVMILALADYLKLLCEKHYGWDSSTKNREGRSVLTIVGNDIVREHDPEFWIKVVSNTMEAFCHQFDVFIISDNRWLTDLKYLKKRFENVNSIYVERPNFRSELSEEQKKHSSENSISPYDCDVWIKASTLDESRDFAIRIVKGGIVG